MYLEILHGSDKQSQRNRCRFHLVILDFIYQRIAQIVIQIQIHVALASPLPPRDKDRVPIDACIAENPQQTLPCIIRLGKLYSNTGNMVESLVGQNVRFDVPTSQ